MKKLILALAFVGMLIGMSDLSAYAQIQGEPFLGPDGQPTRFIRDKKGVLHTEIDGFVVKFSCSPSSVLMSNEVEATVEGAPACPDDLKATLWYCIPNPLVLPDERGMTQRHQGQPDCGKQFTAIRQGEFAPALGAPHGSPIVVPVTKP